MKLPTVFKVFSCRSKPKTMPVFLGKEQLQLVQSSYLLCLGKETALPVASKKHFFAFLIFFYETYERVQCDMQYDVDASVTRNAEPQRKKKKQMEV